MYNFFSKEKLDNVSILELSKKLYPVNTQYAMIPPPSTTWKDYVFYKVETDESINRRKAYTIYCRRFMAEFKNKKKGMANVEKKKEN